MPKYRKNIMDEVKDIDSELLYESSFEDAMYEDDAFIEKLRQKFEEDTGYEMMCRYGEDPSGRYW